MNELKGLFLEGGQANGHKADILEKIWADWEKFASYAFNKSHATCYSWVAFQTAYLKANYPAEYMAAVLSRNLSDIAKLSNYMDECKAMHIIVKGPDINESFSEFSVNAAGDIRFGLSAIKGVGKNVVEGIIAARAKGGKFESVYDLVERVPSGTLNRRVLESLALAGALDCFSDIKREDYFEKNAKDESFSELLLRYGQQYQNAQQDRTASLFGFDDSFSDTEARPAVIPAIAWFDVVKLEKERELVGMYLSAHPLDRFYIELNHGCTTIKDKDELEAKEGAEVTFGGMVVAYTEKTSQRGGKFGVLKIEDYTGSTEIALFGKQFIDFAKFGVIGTPVLVTGRWGKKYNSDELRFNITDMCLLEDRKGTLIKGLTIKTDTGEDKELLRSVLLDNIKNTTKDGCMLNFRIFDPEIHRAITMTSAFKISIDKKFLQSLDELEVDYEVMRS